MINPISQKSMVTVPERASEFDCPDPAMTAGLGSNDGYFKLLRSAALSNSTAQDQLLMITTKPSKVLGFDSEEKSWVELISWTDTAKEASIQLPDGRIWITGEFSYLPEYIYLQILHCCRCTDSLFYNLEYVIYTRKHPRYILYATFHAI